MTGPGGTLSNVIFVTYLLWTISPCFLVHPTPSREIRYPREDSRSDKRARKVHGTRSSP